MSKKDKEYTVDYFEYQANEFKKKYIEELDRVLAIYKRAFELVCEEIANNEQGKTNAFLQIQRIRNKFGIGTFHSYNDYFLERAKKELEECKDGLEN